MANKLTKNGNTRGRKPKGVESIITPMPPQRKTMDLSTLDIIIAYMAGQQVQHGNAAVPRWKLWVKDGHMDDDALRECAAYTKEKSPLVDWLLENLVPPPVETDHALSLRTRRISRHLQRTWQHIGFNGK